MLTLDPVTGYPTSLNTNVLQLLTHFSGEGQSIIRSTLQDLDRTKGSYIWTQEAVDSCNNCLDGLLPNFLHALLEIDAPLLKGFSYDSRPNPA